MSFREDYHRDMAVIHISETEAARDFKGLMERVRSGNEVVIEKPSSVPVVLRAAAGRLGTPISELIEAAADREKERGYPVYSVVIRFIWMPILRRTWKRSFAIVNRAQ